MTDNPIEDFRRYDRAIAKNIRGHCVNCGCPLYIGEAAYIDDDYNLYCNDCVDSIRFDKCYNCDDIADEEVCDKCILKDVQFSRIWVSDN